MNNKIKLVMVGPPEAGKTTLSNFLSQTVIGSSGDYRPTKGCRIVEFEVSGVLVDNVMETAEIELWDVSGDRRYGNCWPAIKQGVNGLIVVYNPGRDDGTRLLESLLTTMTEDLGLNETQCIVVCLKKPGSSGEPQDLPPAFSKVPQLEASLGNNDDVIRSNFTNYISSVFTHMSAMERKQENYILQ